MNTSDLPLIDYTPQLFYHSKATHNTLAPEQFASGNLIKTESKHLLITCKHVFDNIKIDDIIILTHSGFAVRLLPEKTRFISSKSNIDVAIIEFDYEQVSALKGRYSFLHHSNLEFDHIYSSDNTYMLLGFINHQTKLESKAFHSSPFGFLTSFASLKNFEKMGFNKNENIAFDYNRRKQNYIDSDSINFGPKNLKGLSGGGIWHIKQNERQLIQCTLTGIMIEERTEKGIIIGSKINLLRDFLH